MGRTLTQQLMDAEKMIADLRHELRVAVGGCDANDGWAHSPISLPHEKGYIFCHKCGETLTKAQAKAATTAAAIRAPEAP